MNLDKLMKRRSAVAAALIALCAADAVLAVALALKASEPRPIVVVPGGRELRPGRVPEDVARAFAMLYVAQLDNYTPSTIDELSQRLLKQVAPGYWSQASEALERRAQVAKEGRMSSQVLLPAPEDVSLEGLVVTVPAHRRAFIAGKPSREGPVRYRVTLEPAPASPHGLAVAGLVVESEERDED